MTLRKILLGALITGALAAPSLAVAQTRGDQAAVERAFGSTLKREPHPYELRRYALLMDKYGWTEQDVRRDLGERSDYRRYSAGSYDTNAIIALAYQDILGRAPDPAGIQSYRKHIIDEGWSEQDVREALRQSPEYRSGTARSASADRIIRRAYQDILHRDPDPSGLATYRQAIVDDGWDEQDIRQALRKSDERRDQRTGGPAPRGQASVTDIVRNAYMTVLHREPDADGLRDYGARVTKDNWTQADVEKALRDSPEYQRSHRR